MYSLDDISRWEILQIIRRLEMYGYINEAKDLGATYFDRAEELFSLAGIMGTGLETPKKIKFRNTPLIDFKPMCLAIKSDNDE